MPRGGSDVGALDSTLYWRFEPENLKVGDMITGGDIYGKVQENSKMIHYIMLPPDEMGKITYIAKEDHYTIKVNKKNKIIK